MTIDLTLLDKAPRLLFAIPLAPLQGQRFQPTGFPGLGAATFRSPAGDCLLVESAQSMANRLEMTVWDAAKDDVVDAVNGISHVRVNRADGSFLTDTILEAHRLNSPYLMKDSSKAFFTTLRSDLGAETVGPIDRRRLAQVLLKYDIGSLLHGIFLAQPELQGGRLRVARALSAFIEADGVRVAASGGVKNDHVNPSGDTKAGFGNVPFSRDEFTADRITLYVNLDLAQIRSYGFELKVGRLLILLALYKLRALLDGNLRLRTACDLAIAVGEVTSTAPPEFTLPTSKELQDELKLAIRECAGLMQTPKAVYTDPIKSKQGDDTKPVEEDDANDPSEG